MAHSQEQSKAGHLGNSEMCSRPYLHCLCSADAGSCSRVTPWRYEPAGVNVRRNWFLGLRRFRKTTQPLNVLTCQIGQLLDDVVAIRQFVRCAVLRTENRECSRDVINARSRQQSQPIPLGSALRRLRQCHRERGVVVRECSQMSR